MKKINLYQPDGWVDVESILEAGYPFNFITGGRGIGKTYGFIRWMIMNDTPFILLRRTEIESQLQADPKTSSVTAVCNDLDITFHAAVHGKKMRSLYRDDNDHEICLCAALSTFASVRGVDLSAYRYIIYDEFITEPHVRALKMEGIALSNAYETINRNRELSGEDPVRLLALSNSLNISNDIFMQFDLISAAENMLNEDVEIYARGKILLLILQHSPISEKKAGTALYQAASEEYARMSIKNEFILNDFRYVKKQNLKEYKPIWAVGSLYIYEHKSRPEFYITFKKANLPKAYVYGDNYMDLTRMKRDHLRTWWNYLDGMIKFDSYKAVSLFEKYFA